MLPRRDGRTDKERQSYSAFDLCIADFRNFLENEVMFQFFDNEVDTKVTYVLNFWKMKLTLMFHFFKNEVETTVMFQLF